MPIADPESVAARVRALGGRWPAPTMLATVDSTNRFLSAAGSAAEGDCVVADEQTAGRGRLDRGWVSAAGAGLWSSTRVDLAAVPPERWSGLSMVAGLAARRALGEAAGVRVGLKWPNDLLVGGRKIGGVLIEVAGTWAVVGIGINVAWPAATLPPGSTSVLIEGGRTDRAELLAWLLFALEVGVNSWRRSPEQIVEDYRDCCLSIGRRVSAHLPDGTTVTGVAVDVDPGGHLVLRDGAVERFVGAGDVVHATITP